MKLARRLTLGLLAVALLVSAATAQAQALKQLPADALVVIKLNNPQAVSKKLTELTQKLGLAGLHPAFADPLGALKTQLKVKEGFKDDGEVVVGLYEPGQNENDPRVVVLLPVTDYKTFLGNLPNVKEDGNISSFNVPGEPQPLYAVKWGDYAGLSPTKELLTQQPAGMEIAGLAAKQLASNDITAYANVKLLGSKALPMLQGMRPMIVGGLEQELKANPKFNQKFVPTVRTLVEQVLNVAEGTLKQGQSATLGLNISKDAINTTLVGEFEQNTYAANLLKDVKNTKENLLAGLPEGKYFMYTGGLWSAEVMGKIIDDFAAPIRRELEAVGDEGKQFLTMLDVAKDSVSAIDSAAFGYVMPTAPPGQQSILQAVGVYTGDANKIAKAQRESAATTAALMSMMPQAPGMSVKVEQAPGAKTVDGVKLDKFTIQFVFDPQAPGAAQAAQMMQLIYGGTAFNVYSGVVDDKTFVFAMSDNEPLISKAIAAAKKKQDVLSANPIQKAVAAQLPENRAMSMYFFVDNFIATIVQTAAMMGMPIQLKLPPDLPPIGTTFSTEGSAFRIDTTIPSDLVENLIAAAIQMQMQMQRRGPGGRPPGAL